MVIIHGLLVSRLVDLHAARPCHPSSTLSRSIRVSCVKNKDSYTTAAAIGLAAKGLCHHWIYLGRRIKLGIVGALGP